MTGVDNGLPVSVEHRRIVLWNFYVPNGAMIVALAAVSAAALAQVGRNVADPVVQALAYITGGGAGLVAFSWTFGTAIGVTYMVPILKSSTRN